MAAYSVQMKIIYKVFALSLVSLLAGCIAMQPFPQGTALNQPISPPVVRAPKVGQEWVYQVRNVFNQEIIDTVTERVESVGTEIRISRIGAKAGILPDEIQAPWGFVLQDPHWKPTQRFQPVIPLWPEQLKAGWSRFYKTRYQVLHYPDSHYYWGLSMTAIQWQMIETPAGKFQALHFNNEIPYFESNDVFRIVNFRDEDVWFAPEVGRWVIRRGSGRYLTPGVVITNAYWEDFWQWELVSWK